MSIKVLIVGFATVLAVAGIGTMATRDATPASAGAIHTDEDAGDSRGKLSKKDFKQVNVDDEDPQGAGGSEDEVIGTKDDDDDIIEAQLDDDDDDDSLTDTGASDGSVEGFDSVDDDESVHDDSALDDDHDGSGHDDDSGDDSDG